MTNDNTKRPQLLTAEEWSHLRDSLPSLQEFEAVLNRDRKGREAAWERARRVPGAEEVVGTLNGQPMKRITLANIEVFQAEARIDSKAHRAVIKRAATLARAVERSASDLRDLIPQLGNDPVTGPDTLEGCRAFCRAVVTLCEAAREANRTIPPSARKRVEDEVDGAATPGRRSRALAQAVVKVGFPASPAAVRDIMAGVGIERPPEDSADLEEDADKWKKALRPKKRTSRRVPGRVRRKK